MTSYRATFHPSAIRGLGYKPVCPHISDQTFASNPLNTP